LSSFCETSDLAKLLRNLISLQLLLLRCTATPQKQGFVFHQRLHVIQEITASRVLAWTTVNQTLNPIHNPHQHPISHFISSNVKLIYCTTTQNEQRNRRLPAHQSRETVCAFQLVARNITAVVLRTETHSSIGRHIDHVFSLERLERKTYSISCAKTLALRSLRNERG